MYSQLIKLYQHGDMENFSKIAQTYFEIVDDFEVKNTNKRYMVVKISDKNKWRYAGFKKQNGKTLSTHLSVNKINYTDLI